MNWEQITTSTYDKRYPRSPEDEIEYQWHKLVTKEMIGGIENYVSKLYLDPLEPYILIKNRFGYNLEAGIKHYVLWVNPKHTISDSDAERIIRARFPTQKVYFLINPVNFRSILGVIHYHVFIN